MILFPIIQLIAAASFVVLFLSVWVMGLLFIGRSFDDAPIRTMNPYSAKGLEDANARFASMTRQEKTPLGKKMDWALRRLTLTGFIMVFSFGAEWILVEFTSLEKAGL